MPSRAEHVWEWFWELSARRKSGPEPLGYAEIGHWSAITGTQVLPAEVEMITAMDDAFLSEVRKEQDDAAERARERMKGSR